jgi:hypothetical protein
VPLLIFMALVDITACTLLLGQVPTLPNLPVDLSFLHTLLYSWLFVYLITQVTL